MLINLGDSYSLECSVVDDKPSIKIVGECYTVNFCSSNNQEFSYINHGTFRRVFINKSNRIVFKEYVEDYLNDKEVLVVVPSIKGLLYILFDIEKNEVAYSLGD